MSGIDTTIVLIGIINIYIAGWCFDRHFGTKISRLLFNMKQSNLYCLEVTFKIFHVGQDFHFVKKNGKRFVIFFLKRDVLINIISRPMRSYKIEIKL